METDGGGNDGSAGTIYINATKWINSTGSVNATGYNGTTARINFTAPLLNLSGAYNATASVAPNGTITVNYSSCGSLLTGTFQPPYVKAGGCASCAYNISIFAPANNSYFSAPNVTFNVSASLYTTACNLSVSGAANTSMALNSTNTGANYTNTSIADGSYTGVVFCYDALGGSASSNANFAIDTMVPNTSFQIPTPSNGSYVGTSYVPVNVSANDSASNISVVMDFNSSLVSWWRMDDLNSTGGVVDYMGRNNGTAVGGASQTTAGKMGKGFSFDGSSGYVNMPSSSSLNNINNTFTVSFWVYAPSACSNTIGYISHSLSTPRGWSVASLACLSVYIYDGTAYRAGITFPQNIWTHVVYVSNGTNLIAYRNGTNITTSAFSPMSDSNVGITIGRFYTDYNGFYFNGTLDDVMIFNRSLSAAEVQALYANSSAKYLANNYTVGADGNYTFRAYVQDLAGNVNNTGLLTVAVNTTAPSVIMDAPASGSYWDVGLAINGTCLHIAGANAAYTNSSYFSGVDSTGSIFNFTNTSSLVDGTTYTVRVFCNNSANVTGEASVTFTYNPCAPPTHKGWNVSKACAFSATTLTLTQDRNVHVQSGARLLLNSTRLLFNQTANGGSLLRVYPGGSLVVMNGSNVSSANAYKYEIAADYGAAAANFTDSLVSMAGWGSSAGQRGLELNTSNVSFANMSVTGSYYGVYLGSGADSVNVTNSSFSGNRVGVYFGSGADYGNVTSSVMFSNAEGGVFMAGNYSRLENLTINDTGTTGSYAGLYLSGGWNTVLNVAMKGNARGIYIVGSSGNAITNASVTGGTNGLWITGGSANLLWSSNVSGSSNYDLFIGSAFASPNNLTVLDSNYTEAGFDAGSTGSVIRQWHLDVNVTDRINSDPLSDAAVTATDSASAQAFSVSTQASGFIPRQNLTEYAENISGRTYKTNYTLAFHKDPYGDESQQLNITKSMRIDQTMISVFLSRFSVTNASPSRGDTITLYARLNFGDGNGIGGQQMDFYDNSTTLVGTNHTNSTGWASYAWTIPYAWAKGSRTMNVTFPGNASSGYPVLHNTTVDMSIYGLANIDVITMPSGEPDRGVFYLICNATNESSQPLEGYNVTFWDNGNADIGNMTNESGLAIYRWDATAGDVGPHTLNCTIAANDTQFYRGNRSMASGSVTLWGYLNATAGIVPWADDQTNLSRDEGCFPDQGIHSNISWGIADIRDENGNAVAGAYINVSWKGATQSNDASGYYDPPDDHALSQGNDIFNMSINKTYYHWYINTSADYKVLGVLDPDASSYGWSPSGNYIGNYQFNPDGGPSISPGASIVEKQGSILTENTDYFKTNIDVSAADNPAGQNMTGAVNFTGMGEYCGVIAATKNYTVRGKISSVVINWTINATPGRVDRFSGGSYGGPAIDYWNVTLIDNLGANIPLGNFTLPQTGDWDASDNSVGDLLSPTLTAKSRLDNTSDPDRLNSFWHGNLGNSTSLRVFGNLTSASLNAGDAVYAASCDSPGTATLKINVSDDRSQPVTGLAEVAINTPGGSCSVSEVSGEPGNYSCAYDPSDSMAPGLYAWNASVNGSYYHNVTGSGASAIIILGCSSLDITLPLNSTFFNRSDTVSIKVNVTDALGQPVTTANVTANVTRSTGTSAYPTLAYNAGTKLWEGSYGVTTSDPEGMWSLNVSMNKSYFDWANQTIYFNVRRNLTINITSPLANAILYRSSAYSLNSSVNTSDGAPGYNYTVSWRNDSGVVIASGGNTTWTVPTGYSLGVANLTANVTGTYYNAHESSVPVKIYGFSRLGSVTPGTGEVVRGETVDIICGVFDSNFSTPIGGYYIIFKKNSTTQAGISTNSSGYARWQWDTSSETPDNGYNWTCEISANASSYYTPGVSLNYTYLLLTAKLRISNLSVTPATIYRSDNYEPRAANVSGFVWFAAQGVVEGATLSAWDATGEAASCTTDANGFCWAWYNTTMAPGAYQLGINATYAGLTPSDTYWNSMTVLGKLQPWIHLPANSSVLRRGETISLNSTTKDDALAAVAVNATWTTGKAGLINSSGNSTWKIPATYALGPDTLNLSVNKSYHDGNSTNFTIAVWGWANVSMQSPAETEYQYNQSIYVSCLARDNASAEALAGYNVSLHANGTLINYTATNASGSAGYAWTPSGWSTANLGYYNLTCNITDNSTAYYNKSAASTASALVRITDSAKPNMQASVSSTGIEALQSITLSANVTDDIAVDKVWANVTRPDGYSALHPLAPAGGAAYSADYSNTSTQGAYNVSFHANDTSGNENSTAGYNFTVTSTTLVSASVSYASPLTANNRNITLSVTCANTGLVTAYSTNLTSFQIPSGWATNLTVPVQCGNLASGSSCTRQANLTFPSEGFTSSYAINATCQWRNPDQTTDAHTGNATLSDSVQPDVNSWNLTPQTADINWQAVTIRANVTDNIQLSYVQAYVQDGGFNTYSMSNTGGVFWEYNYTPSEANAYTVQIYARDTSGNSRTSAAQGFTAVATTTGSLNLSPSLALGNITKYHSYNHTLAANFSNTGSGTAYYANITITPNSSLWSNVTAYSCGNVSPGGSCLKQFEISVRNATAPGVYNVSGNASWRNPDNTIASAAFNASITVSQNPVLNITQDYLNASVNEGTEQQLNFTLNSEGNCGLDTINFSAGGLPSQWALGFSPGNMSSLAAGGSQLVYVNVSVPDGFTPGNHSGWLLANATGTACSPASNCWKNITFSVSVPSTKTWSIVPSAINKTIYVNSSGNISDINISNTGNEPLNFSISVSGNASSFVGLYNSSPVLVGKQGSFNITVNYTTNLSVAPLYYEANVSVANSSAQPALQSSIIRITVVDNILPNVTNGNVSNRSIEAHYTTTNITANASDNIGVSSVWAYIVKPSSSENFTLTLQAGNYYAGNYTPDANGTYDIWIYANDTSNNVNYTSAGQLTVSGLTTGSLGQAPASETAAGINQTTGHTFNVTLNVTNTGTGVMRNANLSVYGVGVGTVTSSPASHQCGTIGPGSNCTANLSVTIAAGTPRGDVTAVVGKANWTNADYTVGSATNQTSVTIQANSVLNIPEDSISKSVQHNTTQLIGSFTVQSAGNAPINSITVAAAGGNMPGSWITFSPSAYPSVTEGSSISVSVQVAVPSGTAPDLYSTTATAASTDGGSDSVTINVNVLGNGTWYLSTRLLNGTTAAGTSGSLGTVTITNSGNKDINFTLTWTGVQGNGSIYLLTDTPAYKFVSKSSSSNLAIGYSVPSNKPAGQYIVNLTLQNTTDASPTYDIVQLSMWVSDTPPGLWNANVTPAVIDIGSSLTLEVNATDNINVSSVWANVSGPESANVTLALVSGDIANGIYRNASYTPGQAGLYSVTFYANDSAGLVNSTAARTLTVASSTSFNILRAMNTSITGITQSAGYSTNLSVNMSNRGNGTGYYPNASITVPSGWSASPSLISYGSIAYGSSSLYNSSITIPAGTLAGAYSITLAAAWINPDGSAGSNSTGFTVNVASNPLFGIQEDSRDMAISQGGSNTTYISLNSTGNDAVTSISMSCNSTRCPDFSVSFSPQNIPSLAAGSNQLVAVSGSASLGYPPGTYPLLIFANSTQKSDAMTLNIIVPSNTSWGVNVTSVPTLAVGSGMSGTLATIKVSNNGNTGLNFSISAAGNASSMLTLSNSSLYVENQSSAAFSILYSASGEGFYEANVSISNASASPAEINVTLGLSVTAFSVDAIWPTNSNPLRNVSAGSNVTITANASYGHAALQSGIAWKVEFNSTACPVTAYAATGSLWNITCVAPNITDGRNYTLNIQGNNTESGAIATDSEYAAIQYNDVSAPAISSLSSSPIRRGELLNVTANVTDSSNVSSVWIGMAYPNGSSATYWLSQQGSFWNKTFLPSETSGWQQGDYDITLFSNDTLGNAGNATTWFDVYTTVVIQGLMQEVNGSVVNMTFTLYRPGATSVIHSFATNSSGGYYQSVHNRSYDVQFEVYGHVIKLFGSNITNDSADLIMVDHPREGGVPVTGISTGGAYTAVSIKRPPLIVLAVRTNLTCDNATVNLSYRYPAKVYENEFAIRMIKCADWLFPNQTCSTPNGWVLKTGTLDPNNFLYSTSTDSFSAYSLAELAICGMNGCETPYESCVTCPIDCGACPSGTGLGGAGGGVGGGGGTTIEQMVSLPPATVKTTLLEAVLHRGESELNSLTISNNFNKSFTATLEVNGTVFPLVTLQKLSVKIPPASEDTVQIRFFVPEDTAFGTYTGFLSVNFDEPSIRAQSIPVSIRVVPKEEPLLDVNLHVITKQVAPDGNVSFAVTLINMGQTELVDVIMYYSVKKSDSEEVLIRKKETLAVGLTKSYYENISLANATGGGLPPGRYVVEGFAVYADGNRSATALDTFDVVIMPELYQMLGQALFFKFYGIEVWKLVLVAAAWAVSVKAYLIMRKRWAARKQVERRYIFPTSFDKIPKAGPRALWIGKVAESDRQAYFDMDDLTIHAIDAGSTGGGKTVAAMVMVEELLQKGVPVVVFDPTMQWTGFMKPCSEAKMFEYYPRFGMKTSMTRPYKAYLYDVDDPQKFQIDIRKHMKPGELTIFGLTKLKQGDLDEVVKVVIESVFNSNLPEASQLKFVIVFDEVHRLLPKYGGKKGYISLERGMREFRKWGVGMIMISQVISDFRGAIRANVGTEIQLRTKYSGDLNRIKDKYGIEYSKAVVKESVGVAMVQNAQYNDGRPYFVQFRPLLHSPHKLEDAEITELKGFMAVIEEVEARIAALRKRGIDTSDIELELKLASDKVKEGKGRMASLYIDSLKKNLEALEKGGRRK